MDNEYSTFSLKKNKIYKLCTTCDCYHRNYMLFSLAQDCVGRINRGKSLNTLFAINLDGEFKIDSGIGLWGNDVIEPLTLKDWMEVNQHLRGTQFRFNFKTQELIEINK